MTAPKKFEKKLWGDRNARLMSTAPDRAPKSLVNDPSNEAVYKLGTAIQGLTNEGDALILTYAPGDEIPSVGFATGVFVPLARKKISTSFTSLHRSVGLKSGSVLVFDTDESNRVEFGLEPEVQGSLAMVAVDLGLEGSLSVVIFQSAANRFSPRQISALQATCALASGFANAHDPVPPEKLESQVRIDSLENEVRESKEFYDLLLSSISQCHWMLDLDSSRVLAISDNFEEVWGASRRILTEGGLTGFMSTVIQEDRDHVLAGFHNRLGHHFDQEFRVIAEDGETRWIWLRVSPAEIDGTSHVSRLVFIADDVTEKKSEEERIRTKEAELISRARALAVVDLATGVAHEINNPLTVIVGKCAELMRLADKDQLDSKAVAAVAERIQATSVRISEIVKSLKSMSRQDRGEVRVSVALADIAREVGDVVQEKFKAAGVDLEISVPDRDLRAEMNATLISQLVLNLVNNALDAVKTEDEKWVRVEFSDDEDSVYVSVTDSGAGVPIKIRSRIFDPFFTTKPPGQGTGLGLSLATSIAAHHHGSLRLDTFSTRTRFVFQLPKASPGPSPLDR